MSATDFIYKFENKGEGLVAWHDFSVFSSKYGTLVPPSKKEVLFELEFKNPIADWVNVHGHPDKGFSGLSLYKPIENEFINPFIYDVIHTFKMVYFDENCELGYMSVDLEDQIPDGLLDNRLKIINGPDEIRR